MARRTRTMAPQTMLVTVLVAAATLLPNAQAFKDPHNVFCGAEDCYKVLGLEPGADKADIKKAYRSISLDVHPDKNQNPEAKERFTKVAKAYSVFMDEKLNKQYHFFTEHPDAYWLEYGHHWVMRYAASSDVRIVLLGLLALLSFFVYGVQHTRYTTAVQYLRKAAEKNLGPKQGGNAATMQLRREAEALLAQRKGELQGKKNGSESRGSKAKQSRKEKEAELAEVIAELAVEVDIKGSCRKPTWRDQPVVLLAMLPYYTATYLWHKSQLVSMGLMKRELAESERAYWARRTVGTSTWEDLDEDARLAAVDGDAWMGGDAMEDWKQTYLYGGSATSSKGLRKRKSSSRGSPVNGSVMKGVLGEGPAVEY